MPLISLINEHIVKVPVVFGKRDNNHDDATTGFKTPRNTELTGTLSLGGLNGLFGNNPHEDDLSRRLFALVCRAEGLRGRALASISLRNLNLISTGELRFEARFQSLLGAELPRVGITQILLGTSLYGLLSAWLFRSRDSYASRSFQVMRYINATIEALMPTILLFSVCSGSKIHSPSPHHRCSFTLSLLDSRPSASTFSWPSTPALLRRSDTSASPASLSKDSGYQGAVSS